LPFSINGKWEKIKKKKVESLITVAAFHSKSLRISFKRVASTPKTEQNAIFCLLKPIKRLSCIWFESSPEKNRRKTPTDIYIDIFFESTKNLPILSDLCPIFLKRKIEPLF